MILKQFNELDFKERFRLMYAWQGSSGITHIYFPKINGVVCKNKTYKKIAKHVIEKHGKSRVYMRLYEDATRTPDDVNSFLDFVSYTLCS